MDFGKIRLLFIIGLTFAAFGSGYLLGDVNMHQETDVADRILLETDDGHSDFEMVSLQISSISSGLAKNKLPEAGDIYMLRLSAAELSSLYVRLGYEDLGALNSHGPSLTYLEESCFNIMTADFVHYTYDEWCMLLEKLEPLRELGQNSKDLTLEQMLSQLDELLNSETQYHKAMQLE